MSAVADILAELSTRGVAVRVDGETQSKLPKRFRTGSSAHRKLEAATA
jgi:hypothetical protein